jgi:cell shape-determining protein MreC
LAGLVVLFFGSLVTADEPVQLEELRLVLDKVRAQNTELKSELELRETVIRKLQESLTVARSESELFQRRWADAQLRAQTLGANPSDTEAVAAQRQLAETVRQLAATEVERQRLVAQLQRLLTAVQANANVQAEMEATQALLASASAPSATGSAPAVTAGRLESAKLLDANPKLRLVVLDVGEEQGVRVGMPFVVFRGDRVVAEVRVVEVRSRVCGAQIERVDKGVTLQAGDTARVTKTMDVMPR